MTIKLLVPPKFDPGTSLSAYHQRYHLLDKNSVLIYSLCKENNSVSWKVIEVENMPSRKLMCGRCLNVLKKIQLPEREEVKINAPVGYIPVYKLWNSEQYPYEYVMHYCTGKDASDTLCIQDMVYSKNLYFSPDIKTIPVRECARCRKLTEQMKECFNHNE